MKRFKIVMLEAEESNIYLHGNKLYDVKTSMHIPDGKQTPQHLYLIDTEAEIKTDDWYIMHNTLMNQVEDSEEANRCNNYPEIKSDCKKIIASSDLLQNIPQLSDQSIQLLVDYYNKNGKMPDDVDIIYYNVGINEESSYFNTIVTNEQGEVDITIPEERMYSRSEVLNLLTFVNDRLPDLYSKFSPEDELIEWSNLK